MAKLCVAVSVVVVALAGCLSAGDDVEAETEMSANTVAIATAPTADVPSNGVVDDAAKSGDGTSVPLDSSGRPDSADEIDRLVEAAVVDLAKRMSVEISEVSVDSAQIDHGQGTCPNTDRHGIDSDADGVAIELAIGSRKYWYRQTGTGEVHLCVDGQSLESGPGSHLIPPTTTP